MLGPAGSGPFGAWALWVAAMVDVRSRSVLMASRSTSATARPLAGGELMPAGR